MILLVTVTWTGAAGGVLRVASEPCEVGAYVYAGGADLVGVEELGDVGDAPQIGRYPVRVVGVDVAAAVAAGHRLARAPVEIAVLRRGDGWAARRVLVSGVVADPVFGLDGEPLRFAALAVPRVGVIPASADTPIAIGYPGAGVDRDGVVLVHAGVQPGLVVEDGSGGMIGRVISLGAVEAATAWVWTQGDTDYSEDDVTVTLDQTGRLVSMVEYRAGDLWAMITPRLGNGGGGLMRLEGDTAARTARDVLRVVHFMAGVPVDELALAACPSLGAILLDGTIEDEVDAVEWVAQTVMPCLPVAATWGAGGVVYVEPRVHATVLDAVASIDADTDGTVSLVGDVLVEAARASSVTVRYLWDLATGQGSQTVVATGPGGGGDVTCAAMTDASATPMVVDAPMLGDLGAAMTAAARLAEVHGRQRWRMSYMVDAARYAHLRLGDVVAITHTAIGLVDRPAQVWGLEWGADDVLGVSVIIWG